MNSIAVSANILSSTTLLKNKNCFWAQNQHIRMISEGPCDIEDCNNAENTAMHYINYI